MTKKKATKKAAKKPATKAERKVPAGKIDWKTSTSKTHINYTAVVDGMTLDLAAHRSKRGKKYRVFNRVTGEEFKEFETINSAQAFIRKEWKKHQAQHMASGRTYLVAGVLLLFAGPKLEGDELARKIDFLQTRFGVNVAEIDTTGRTHREVMRQFKLHPSVEIIAKE
jgi:hypothetical protein